VIVKTNQTAMLDFLNLDTRQDISDLQIRKKRDVVIWFQDFGEIIPRL
jgi:hypothetical protein